MVSHLVVGCLRFSLLDLLGGDGSVFLVVVLVEAEAAQNSPPTWDRFL